MNIMMQYQILEMIRRNSDRRGPDRPLKPEELIVLFIIVFVMIGVMIVFLHMMVESTKKPDKNLTGPFCLKRLPLS